MKIIFTVQEKAREKDELREKGIGDRRSIRQAELDACDEPLECEVLRLRWLAAQQRKMIEDERREKEMLAREIQKLAAEKEALAQESKREAARHAEVVRLLELLVEDCRASLRILAAAKAKK